MSVERDGVGTLPAESTPQRRRRKILVGCVVPLGIVALPPAWILADWWFWDTYKRAQSGVVERIPTPLASSELPTEFLSALDEWGTYRTQPRQDALSAPFDVAGQLKDVDCSSDGDCVYQSHVGSDWMRHQHLYLHNAQNQSIVEVTAFNDMVVSSPTLLRHNGRHILLVHRLNRYDPVRPSTFVRIAQSWSDPSLRPEDALLLFDPELASIEFIGPGAGIVLSPDRNKVAFLRSDGYGFHSIHVWHPDSNSIDTVLSLWENDPRSGRSFSFAWSMDSQFLLISGTTGSYSRDYIADTDHAELPLVFDSVSRQMYKAP